MKNGIIKFISGLVVGIGFTLIVLFMLIPKQMFIENESKLGFEETVAAIEKSAVENNWSIPHIYNLQATMKKHGFDVAPIKVFSMCKPEHAYEILKTNNERMVAALMPCRIAIYEKDGKTYVSMLNSGLFSKLLNNKISSVMGIATKENLQILEPVLQK